MPKKGGAPRLRLRNLNQNKNKKNQKIVVCSGRAVRSAVRTWKVLEVAM